MILLLGMGKGNTSIKKYFEKNNINFITFDDSDTGKNINIFEENNIQMIIKSNGISNDHMFLEKAKKYNIKVISDLQFYYDISNIKNYILVTGSNGKTTIVSLLEKCLKNSVAIGNNGLPLFDYIDDEKYKILEVSSFMLEKCNYIKYKYNIISNIYPTHLEHHKTFINYIKAKLSFLKFLSINDYVIYNDDDLILNRIINCYDCNKINVSLKNKKSTVYLHDNFIYYLNNKIMSIENVNLLGLHNIYNIMLVIGAIFNHKLLKENYIDEIINFKGVEYRMEIVYNNEIKIINDSKSTNFKALNEALNSINDKLTLIVGGKKREDNYSILINNINKLNIVYCYGENKNDFYEFFKENGVNCFKYDTLNDVIKNMNNNSKIILFSPGSVSYDQFRNFEERGKIFNQLIKNKYNFN